MRRKSLIAVVLSFASAARAEVKPPIDPKAHALPARPPLALQELAPLFGLWRCTGTLRTDPVHPALHTQGIWSFARDLDGFWVAVAFEHEPSAVNPAPAKGKGHFGYDEDQSRFSAGLALNDGTSEQSSSGGWEGPRLVFQGQLRDGDERVTFRRTFERKRGGLHLTLELQLDEGKWTQVSEESCARPPANEAPDSR